MLHALILAIFIGSVTVVTAQEQSPPTILADPLEGSEYVRTAKPIICSSSRTMLNDIKRGKSGETDIQFLGLQDSPIPGIQFAYTIHRNLEKGTWTFVESSSTGNSCILAVGIGEIESKGPAL